MFIKLSNIIQLNRFGSYWVHLYEKKKHLNRKFWCFFFAGFCSLNISAIWQEHFPTLMCQSKTSKSVIKNVNDGCRAQTPFSCSLKWTWRLKRSRAITDVIHMFFSFYKTKCLLWGKPEKKYYTSESLFRYKPMVSSRPYQHSVSQPQFHMCLRKTSALNYCRSPQFCGLSTFVLSLWVWGGS